MSDADNLPDSAPYLRIASHYRDQIRGGELQPGDRLPTVREIASTWGVARPTADKALAMLRAEGLVTTAGRGGTRVAGASQVAAIAITIDEPDDLRVASAEVMRASDVVTADLDVPPGSAVTAVRLEQRTDG